MMNLLRLSLLLAAGAVGLAVSTAPVRPALAAEPFITLQSTTSTQNSGLYDHILPMFTARTGITVRVVAVGTGQAIRNARNGDGDVLLVHHRASEVQFVADGAGVRRHDVMYNDFVLVGPAADPAGVAGGRDIVAALQTVAALPFVSRGDDSGTHKRELSLWQAAAVDVAAASGRWYRETGSGMGTTLMVAIGMDAYTLTDRSSWLTFGNKGSHRILVEGDARLVNQYGVILVNPARHPTVKAAAGQAFIDWLTGAAGQAAIASHRVAGRQAFFPNAQ